MVSDAMEQALYTDLCDFMFNICLPGRLKALGEGGAGTPVCLSLHHQGLVQDLTLRWDSNELMNEHSSRTAHFRWKLGTSKQVGAHAESCQGRHFPVLEKGKGRILFLVGKVITAVCIQGGKEAGRNKEVNSLETFIPICSCCKHPNL